MKLDKEEDRALLLEIIGNAQILGSSIFVLAGLVTRIQNAVVEVPNPEPKSPPDSK